MKLIQISKEGRYASYWLKSENRGDMLELRKLTKDMEAAGNPMLKADTITTGSETADDTGELLPIRLLFNVEPSGKI